MRMMLREGIFKIEEVLPFVSMKLAPHGKDAVESRPQRIYNGKVVHMDSMRYQTFVKSGTACVNCGLQAVYFALEQHVNLKKPIKSERKHLNLYAVDSDNREVLFTKDHIVPRARGGSNHLDNMQTMCAPCNNAKGHSTDPRIDPRLARTGRTSRNRIKRLKHKCIRELQSNKERRKEHYQAGTSDGGPVFVQYKKRYTQVLNRLELLNEIDRVLLKNRQKYQRKTYKLEQESIYEQRMRVHRMRRLVELAIAKNKRRRAAHYIPNTADGGPVFVSFRNRHKQLLRCLKRLTKIAQKLKRDARVTEKANA
jgi:hypothetical protein